MFQTIRYKAGYIHLSYVEGKEIVRAQVDGHAYLVYVKSLHAAKLVITKHNNKLGVIK